MLDFIKVNKVLLEAHDSVAFKARGKKGPELLSYLNDVLVEGDAAALIATLIPKLTAVPALTDRVVTLPAPATTPAILDVASAS